MRLEIKSPNAVADDPEAGQDALLVQLAKLRPSQVDERIDSLVSGTAAQQITALKAITKALAKAVIVLSRAR